MKETSQHAVEEIEGSPQDDEQDSRFVVGLECHYCCNTSGKEIAGGDKIRNMACNAVCHKYCFYLSLAIMVSLPVVFCPNCTQGSEPNGK